MKFNSIPSMLVEKALLKALLALPLFMLLAGCATPDYSGPMAAPNPDDTNSVPAARLHVGDTIIISFDGLPDPIPSQEKTINEDGTITLADIGSVSAAGQTTGDLEALIYVQYVPKYYKHLTVTVKAGDRVFYVNGEVGNKGRQVYVGQITVTKAITSAGGFTEFANRKNVLLIRTNGQRYKIDCERIMQGEAPDPPVYPGDQIEVKRRLL